MIKVVDAIMGTGKSTAAITYMNEHPEKKFVYIAPYLDEAKRIKDACPELHFIEPSDKIEEFRFSKTLHSKFLLENGRNIASSHAMFKLYDEDMLQAIREQDYTLIVDESVDVFVNSKFPPGDIELMIRAGVLEEVSDCKFVIAKEVPYDGSRLDDIYSMIKHNTLVVLKDKNGRKKIYYWELPMDIISAFRDTYVLTYMFESQDLYYYFMLNDVEYEKIGVEKGEDEKFRFSSSTNYIPGYIETLDKHIHIFYNDKLNSIGDTTTALSMNWYHRGNDVGKLKSNLYNYFMNYYRDSPSKDKMFASYKESARLISGKGYSSGKVMFNIKATNDYSNKTVLAYPVNIFSEPDKNKYMFENGIEYDQDALALSTMVQWIWRSAIRTGKEIAIYIPSKRMRNLLENWIYDVMTNYGKENKEKTA